MHAPLPLYTCSLFPFIKIRWYFVSVLRYRYHACYWTVFLHTILHASIVVVWLLVGHCFGVASVVRNEGVGTMDMRRKMAPRSTWHLRPPHRPPTSGSDVVSQHKRELQQWLQGHLLSHWGTLSWELDTLAQGPRGWNCNPGFLIVCPESFLFFH